MDDEARYDLRAQFVHKGYRYATDGRILVRVRCDEPDTTGRPLPNVEGMLESSGASWDDCDKTIPPPHGTRKGWKTVDCDCGGPEYEDCDTCDGNGFYTCEHCGSEVDCEECDGEGSSMTVPKCARCGGDEFYSVQVTLAAYVKIGGRTYDGEHVNKILALGDARCGEPNAKNGSLSFVVGDVQGIVMPIRVSGDEG